MEARNEFVPFSISHPGEILGEELKARGIKQKDFARQIGMQPTHLNSLIRGKMDVSEKIAARLELALGIPFADWMNLQANYHYYSRVIKERDEEEYFALQKEKDYADWLNLKCVYDYLGIRHQEARSRIQQLEQNECLSGSFEYDLGYYRKSNKCQVDERNMRTWLFMVNNEACKMSLENEYVVGNAALAAREIATGANEQILTVAKIKDILNRHGIVYLHVPKLTKTPVDAYSMRRNGRYVIAATYRYNDMDKLAFDIIHELGHVALHIKNDNDSFIRMDEAILDTKEKEADKFASEMLIPSSVWKSMMATGANSLNPYCIVEQLVASAKTHHISPTIAVARYKKESNLYNFPKYRSAKIS